MRDHSEVYRTCDRFYRERQITKCNNVLGASLRYGGDNDTRLHTLSEVLITALVEKSELPVTLHEYLPLEWRANLDVRLQTWGAFRQTIHLLFLQYLH